MREKNDKAQWALYVTVWHSQTFGHYITVETQTQGRHPKGHSGGSWKGLGIPEQVLSELNAMLQALVTEHLVTRYGVQGELPMRWAGEPDPF